MLPFRVSDSVDYFAPTEKEAYSQVKNIFFMLNYGHLHEELMECDNPLYSTEELNGLAPQDFEYQLDVKSVREKRQIYF